MKNITHNHNGHRQRAVGFSKRNRNHRGLGRLPIKVQVLLLIWVFVSTMTAGCLLWVHHKAWLLAILMSLGSFLWQARLTVAELFLELWVFILRVIGRND